jgi:prepilin-type N-terminal cleavage/methylation domain-containing protein/prepilin-type processing-associated H-X9-DG protein
MKRGFTLTEMLTVIAIMAILMALLFPVFSTSREKARQNACLTNLKQVGTALTAYAQDYDDVNVLSHDCGLSWRVGAPVLFAHLLLPYTRSTIVYACGSHPTVPTFGNPNAGVPNIQVSYAINANNDAVIRLDCSIIDCTRQNPPYQPPPECLRLVGFAGISRVRIPQPENRLALMEAPTENNPTLTPPNGWRLYDPTRDPTTMGCWLQALPVDNPIDCWTNQPVLHPAGRRHTGGANYLFADGSAKWVSLLQVQQNWVAQ